MKDCQCLPGYRCMGMPNRFRKLAPEFIKGDRGWLTPFEGSPPEAFAFAAEYNARLQAIFDQERAAMDSAIAEEYGPGHEEATCISGEPVVWRKALEPMSV